MSYGKLKSIKATYRVCESGLYTSRVLSPDTAMLAKVLYFTRVQNRFNIIFYNLNVSPNHRIPIRDQGMTTYSSVMLIFDVGKAEAMESFLMLL